MRCPSEITLSRFTDNGLSVRTTKMVVEHIKICSSCLKKTKEYFEVHKLFWDAQGETIAQFNDWIGQIAKKLRK